MAISVSSIVRSMTKPAVSFDESGNTGQNLLDANQPHFVLVAVHFAPDEARALIDLVGSRAQELHGTDMKRRGGGRGRLMKFLESPLLSPARVKIAIAHKEFMVVAKIVDLLVEPLALRRGIDLYDRGANIAMANMLYACMPVLCGVASFETLLAAFVRMIRQKDDPGINAFYAAIRETRECCRSDEFARNLDLLSNTGAVVRDVLDSLATTENTQLDPAVPLFISLCAAWGDQLGVEFDVLHDRSKPIERLRPELERFMDKRMSEVTVGNDRRMVKLPLKATGITPVDSELAPQVQLADLVAGLCAASLKHPAGDPEMASLAEERCKPLVVDGIWPTTDVTPEALETERVTEGPALADGIGEFLKIQRSLPPTPERTS